MNAHPREALTAGSLFSGIGGMDEGVRRAGYRHLFFAEASPYRRDVLRARFPAATVYDDVRAVGVEPTPGTATDGRGAEPDGTGGLHSKPVLGLLAGGFPCQDVSVAGERAGLAGNRSGLFFELARVADTLRPRWLLIENVPGLFSSNGGRDFGVVLGTLADIGYGVAWRVLDSRYFGVPQRRRRVFIVGALAGDDPRGAAERAGAVLAVGSRCDRHPAARGEAGPDVAVASLSGLGNGGPDDNDGQAGRLVAATLKANRGKAGGGLGPEETLVIADTLTSGSHPKSNAPGRCREDDTNIVAFSLRSQPRNTSQGNWQVSGSERTWIHDKPEHSRSLTKTKTLAVHAGTSVRRLLPVECERLQGLPDGWTDLGGTADSKRYSALGDAVTANTAEWIARRIAATSTSSELGSLPASTPSRPQL